MRTFTVRILLFCLLAHGLTGTVYAVSATTITAPPLLLAADASSAGDEDLYNDDLYSDDLYGDEDTADDDALIADPLETVNRGVFWFNDKCYFYLLKPIAKGWRIVPQPVRTGLGNMFANLSTPIHIANAMLQLKFDSVGSETLRLLVNTTIGLGGFFDPAADLWKIDEKKEDFGQTLGYYGVGEGFYLVLPFLGASDLRDGIGMIPDSYAYPVRWFADNEVVLGVKGAATINGVSIDRDTYESIVNEQLDPYLFIRDAYIQHRRAQVEDK